MENQEENKVDYNKATAQEIAMAKLSGELPQDWTPEEVKLEPVIEEVKGDATKQILGEDKKTDYKQDDVDYEKLTDGKFKSKEDITKFFEELETHKKNSEKLSVFEKELDEYKKAKVIKIEDDEDFVSQVYKPYQIGKALGIKDKYIVNKIADITNLSDDDVIKLKEVMESPELKDDKKLLDKIVNDTYKIDPLKINPEYEELEQEEKDEIDLQVKVNKTRMKKDANKFRESITDKLKDIKLPESKSAEDIAAEDKKQGEEVVAKWSTPFKKLVEDTKSVALSYKDGDDVISFDMQLTKEEQAEINQVGEDIAKFILTQKLPYTEETAEYIKKSFNSELKIKLHDKIIAHTATFFKERAEEKMREEINNPSKKVQGKSVKQEQTTSEEDAALAKLKNERY